MDEPDGNSCKSAEDVENNSKQNQHPVFQFIDCDRNKFVCKICDHAFSNSHAGNMRKHIERNHKLENAMLQKSLESYYADDKLKKKKESAFVLVEKIQT